MDCARNIITANFGGGTSATTAPLWQWDYGQVLCITGIDLPAAFEVHFSTNRMGGVSTVAVGADGQVTIPNDLLTIGKNLNAWIYLSDAQGEGETEYSITIPVKARPMPETYDAEVSGEFDDVVRQVSEYAQIAQTAADNAGASATAAAASADSAAASASAAETAKNAAETAQGNAEDAQSAAETAAQTATQKAQQTAQDAAQAALDAGRAESAAGRAEAAETGAESAKTNAETAAQDAADSASAASASASSAGQAATAAAGSASAAAQSAASIEGDVQTATQKATEAQMAAGQAVTAKDAAVTAQQGAETAATNAGQSASTATAKAAEAAQSATDAAASKTAAEAAATRAETAAASLTVDDALSDSSVNPVQNRVITGELTNVKSHLSDVKELVADVDTHQETATETTTPTWAQGYTAPDGSVGSSTTLYYCTPINVSEGDVIQPTRGDGGLIASVYYLTVYYNNSAVSALGGNNVSMPYTVPSGVDQIVFTIASVYLDYGTPKIKRTYTYNIETLYPKFIDKSGVGQVKTQNIKGMTEIGAGISPNLFPKATLLESGKYIGGIDASTGKAVLYANASYDTYILPVDGESVYSFTYVRFGCVVADIALTVVGNILSEATQINSTGGNYILFSFAPSVNPPSDYIITNEIIYYEVPNNWVYGTPKAPKDSTSGAIASDGSLEITGRSALKDGEVITFKGFFESFNGFSLNFYATAVTNFITVTASTITIKSTTITPAAINHGLTIENYVSLECQFINGKLKITLYSNGGSYTTTVDWYQIGGEVTQPQIISNGTAFTNAILSVSYDATKRDVWYFGDSYVGVIDPARWAYYLTEDGFLQNVLLNGASGGSSNGSVISFNTLLKYGTPKIAVFATGMNDGNDSSSAPPTAYVTRRTEFLKLCEKNRVEPVFCTVPTVPTVNNEQKNAWVRASGYRYIDFAKAVGADENGVWYSGMLSSDNVHPSVTGAKALYTQVLVDLPEVAVA